MADPAEMIPQLVRDVAARAMVENPPAVPEANSSARRLAAPSPTPPAPPAPAQTGWLWLPTPTVVYSGGQTAWTTYDMSAYVPATASIILLSVQLVGSGSGTTEARYREDSGSTEYLMAFTQDNTGYSCQAMVPCSSAQAFDFEIPVTGTSFAVCKITLLAYFV